MNPFFRPWLTIHSASCVFLLLIWLLNGLLIFECNCSFLVCNRCIFSLSPCLPFICTHVFSCFLNLIVVWSHRFNRCKWSQWMILVPCFPSFFFYWYWLVVVWFLQSVEPTMMSSSPWTNDNAVPCFYRNEYSQFSLFLELIGLLAFINYVSYLYLLVGQTSGSL